MKNPRNIYTVGPDNYWEFGLPIYEVTDEGLISEKETFIKFCKGDKSDPLKERQEGLFVESFLEVCAQRLKGVNVGELSSRETSVAITKIEEAIMWLEKRSNDRKIREVEGTYNK